jgi:molybdopterin-containing oxidoreductase family iron-sulfur binding subunit
MAPTRAHPTSTRPETAGTRPEPAETPTTHTRAAAPRRRFLQTLGAGAATLLALDVLESLAAAPAAAAPPAAAPAPATTPGPPAPPAGGSDAAPHDVLVRMRADLERALRKPATQRRWAMVIDLRKCVGCSACTIACVAENKLPPGVVYRPVVEEEIGTYPHVTRRFLPRPCMQCDNPPCVPVCPVAATYKRPDGIVAIDYDRCIGCRYCIVACPYNARTFDAGERYTDGTPEVSPVERLPAFEYGQRRTRQHDASPVGNARKCHFCIHRLEAGLLPACVSTCIGRATYFGDASDPDSLVSELVARPNVMRLKEELGTQPRVYYLL